MGKESKRTDIKGSCSIGFLSSFRDPSSRQTIKNYKVTYITMRAKLFLQFTLLSTVLFITMSEGFFLDYPKKLIMDILHSIKDKKEAKKKTDLYHYHVHYYPVHPLLEPPMKAPGKYELEDIHNKHLAALGWSNQEYQYIPEPKITISSSVNNLWKNTLPWEHDFSDDDLYSTVKRSEDEDIYVQVPLNQKITIDHSHFQKKLDINLLSKLLYKLFDSKNTIQS